jgi:hypothetical protein
MGYAKGHLLARSLGGHGTGPLARQNLAIIQHEPFNTPLMSSIERRVRHFTDSGEEVWYQVTAVRRPGQPIPVGFNVVSVRPSGAAIDLTILNPPGIWGRNVPYNRPFNWQASFQSGGHVVPTQWLPWWI